MSRSAAAADATQELISGLTSLLSGPRYSSPESAALLRRLSAAPGLAPDDARSVVEKLAVLAGTDVERNSADPLGDGDQSLVLEGGETARQILRDLFNKGGYLGPHLVHKNEGFSPFAMACGLGNLGDVEALVRETEEGSEERIKLLERIGRRD